MAAGTAPAGRKIVRRKELGEGVSHETKDEEAASSVDAETFPLSSPSLGTESK